MPQPNNSKKPSLTRDQKYQRTQRVIFVAVSIILILSWVLVLVAK